MNRIVLREENKMTDAETLNLIRREISHLIDELKKIDFNKSSPDSFKFIIDVGKATADSLAIIAAILTEQMKEHNNG